MFYNSQLFDYLGSIKSKLFDEKYELDKEYKEIHNHIIENEKMIHLLDESSDPNFESFTPRDVNKKNRTQIDSLITEKNELESNGTIVKGKIDDISIEIDKLDQLFLQLKRDAHKYDKVMDDLSKNNCRDYLVMISNYIDYLSKNQYSSIIKKLDDIIFRVELCTHILVVDKNRCQHELERLLNDLKDIEKNDICADSICYPVPNIKESNSDLSNDDCSNDCSNEFVSYVHLLLEHFTNDGISFDFILIDPNEYSTNISDEIENMIINVLKAYLYSKNYNKSVNMKLNENVYESSSGVGNSSDILHKTISIDFTNTDKIIITSKIENTTDFYIEI